MGILIHLAWRSLQTSDGRERGECGDAGGWTVWIGRRCHPYPRALIAQGEHGRRLLERSIFVDAPEPGERAWAIDLALRSAGVATVVADASAMTMAATRRLQLSAASGRALGLLARPPWEFSHLSAARTRWLITPAPPAPTVSPIPAASFVAHPLGLFSPRAHAWGVHPPPLASPEPRWTVELLRCKGMQPGPEEARRWTVRRDHETGHVSLAVEVPDRSAEPSWAASRRTA